MIKFSYVVISSIDARQKAKTCYDGSKKTLRISRKRGDYERKLTGLRIIMSTCWKDKSLIYGMKRLNALQRAHSASVNGADTFGERPRVYAQVTSLHFINISPARNNSRYGSRIDLRFIQSWRIIKCVRPSRRK